MWTTTKHYLSWDHRKDAEYLNKIIQNYTQMQTMFSYILATGRFFMGSSEPLGVPSPDYLETQESLMALRMVTTSLQLVLALLLLMVVRGRGTSSLVDDEVIVFTNMLEAVKEVEAAIRHIKHVYVHLGPVCRR
jgi:hypothetical protein